MFFPLYITGFSVLLPNEEPELITHRYTEKLVPVPWWIWMMNGGQAMKNLLKGKMNDTSTNVKFFSAFSLRNSTPSSLSVCFGSTQNSV